MRRVPCRRQGDTSRRMGAECRGRRTSPSLFRCDPDVRGLPIRLHVHCQRIAILVRGIEVLRGVAPQAVSPMSPHPAPTRRPHCRTRAGAQGPRFKGPRAADPDCRHLHRAWRHLKGFTVLATSEEPDGGPNRQGRAHRATGRAITRTQCVIPTSVHRRAARRPGRSSADSACGVMKHTPGVGTTWPPPPSGTKQDTRRTDTR